jgi:hypothetical protein
LTPIDYDEARNNLWSMRNDIENFQYGLEHKLHKTEGWLWQRLVQEGLVSDTQESLREKCYQAYQAQKIFIMAQKQLMPAGWNPIDPMNSVKHQKGTGQFMSKQRLTNPVPANVLTASFLRYAYGVKKETFRRWMGQGAKFPERVPVNKGKNIIDDITMAAQYFTPKRLFMQHEMEQFTASKEGKCATPEEKKKHRAFLKEHFKVLPADVLEVYVKASRERMAYHGFIEEATVDTLNDNNEQAFRQLDKVQPKFLLFIALICTNFILSSM